METHEIAELRQLVLAAYGMLDGLMAILEKAESTIAGLQTGGDSEKRREAERVARLQSE